MRNVDEGLFCREAIGMRQLILLLLSCLATSVAFALSPQKHYGRMPNDSIFSHWEATRVKTSDKYGIAVWKFPLERIFQKDHKTTVVIAGDDAGNMGNWLELVHLLTYNGFDVVTFDYRGFGASDTFKTDPRRLYYKEYGEDMKAAVKYAKKAWPDNKVAIYAASMSTIIAARVWRYLQADYFIGEGFVTDPDLVVERMYKWKGRKLTLPGDTFTHAQYLQFLPQSMLLFIGKYDMTTSIADCESIKASHPGTVIQPVECGHGEYLQTFTAYKNGRRDEALFDHGYSFLSAVQKFTR
jgi:hypothetical protein